MSLLSKLHRNEEAQVSFLAVAAALCFVALLAMIMNTNDIVRHRVHMQEVADISALSAGTWDARGMNLVAMTNVLNSKLLTMTVLVNSLNRTLPIVEQIAQAQAIAFAGCTGVPIVGVFCAVMKVVVEVQKAIITAMKNVIAKIAVYTKCNAAVWKAMSGLQTMAEGVRKSFPSIALAESVNIARANGATLGVALNGGILTGLTGAGGVADAAFLPVSSKGKKTSDFCDAMKAGGPGYVMEGYDEGQGPVRLGKKIWDIVFIPFFNLLPHPIFYGFYSFYMAQIGCVGDPDENDDSTEVKFYNLPDCRKYKATAKWERYKASTGLVSNSDWTITDFTDWKPLNQEDGGDPVDTSKFDGLGGFGKGDPTGPASDGLTHGKGYLALKAENNERNTSSKSVSCTASASSGYPINCPGGATTCVSLRNNPRFKLFTRGGEPVGDYYMNMKRDIEKVIEKDENDEDIEVTYYEYTVDVWVLADGGSKELEGEDLDEYVQNQQADSIDPNNTPDSSNSGSCKNKIQPLLLEENSNAENRLRHIAMVYKNLGKDGKAPLPFWSRFFDDPPDRITAYAQSQVYNDLSEDMFTQDWRTRLEQASLLEAALSQAGQFDLGMVGEVAEEFLGSVNNH